MTEIDEIAETVAPERVKFIRTFTEARHLADLLLFSDETETMRDNLAEALLQRARRIMR